MIFNTIVTQAGDRCRLLALSHFPLRIPMLCGIFLRMELACCHHCRETCPSFQIDEEIGERLLVADAQFLSEPVACTFHSSDGEVGVLGNLLSVEIESQQGAEFQIGGCEGGIPAAQFSKEVLMNQVEVLLEDVPNFLRVSGIGFCNQVLEISVCQQAAAFLLQQLLAENVGIVLLHGNFECH